MKKKRLFYLNHKLGSSRLVNEYHDDLESVLKRINHLSGGYDFSARVVKHKLHHVIIGLDGVVYNLFEEELSEEDLARTSPIIDQTPQPLIDGCCSKCGKEVPRINVRCINCGQLVLRRKDNE